MWPMAIIGETELARKRNVRDLTLERASTSSVEGVFSMHALVMKTVLHTQYTHVKNLDKS